MWIHRLKRFFASDFAFRQDTTLGYLPIVIAFLTLLSICMTHSSAYIKHVTLDNNATLSQRLHVHLPYEVDADARKAFYDELATFGDIETVEEVSRQEIQHLLGRWLSIDNDLSKDFPLPVIIEIFLLPDADRDQIKKDIGYYLKSHIKGALLESYDDSISAFNQSAQLVKTGVYLLGLVVLCTTTMIVVIISRISLGVHRKHIEVLHHLGANDHYINRQFIKRTTLIGAQGVLAGTLLSVAFIEIIKVKFYGALLPMGDAFSSLWLYYIINPVLLMILIVLAAWLSIEAQLKRMH